MENAKSNPRIERLMNGNHIYTTKYWVPIVCYDKSFLCGFLHCNSMLSMSLGVPRLDVPLDSTRFSDIIDAKGTRVSDLKAPEVEKLLFDKLPQNKPKHPENKEGILPPGLLEINCACGGYYIFNSYEQIPEQSFSCGICDKILIDYIGLWDNKFIYDGNPN